VIVVYGWIYRLNENAVAVEFDPRRDRLDTLPAAFDVDDNPIHDPAG
jgi:hypothetical protein